MGRADAPALRGACKNPLNGRYDNDFVCDASDLTESLQNAEGTVPNGTNLSPKRHPEAFSAEGSQNTEILRFAQDDGKMTLS